MQDFVRGKIKTSNLRISKSPRETANYNYRCNAVGCSAGLSQLEITENYFDHQRRSLRHQDYRVGLPKAIVIIKTITR